jgi:WD40 repeat protein
VTKHPLQSLSVSPDQRFVVVGGRDILRLIKLDKANDTGNDRLFSRDKDLENELAGLTTTYPGMDEYDASPSTTANHEKTRTALQQKASLNFQHRFQFLLDRDLKTGSMNLNHNGNDVAFHPQNNQVIATGSTKGAVVCWNLEIAGRKAARAISTEHTRTVTRVDWHPTTPWLLASGSIDGTVKIWDTRRDGKKFKASKTIKPKASAVRDAMYVCIMLVHLCFCVSLMCVPPSLFPMCVPHVCSPCLFPVIVPRVCSCAAKYL